MARGLLMASIAFPVTASAADDEAPAVEFGLNIQPRWTGEMELDPDSTLDRYDGSGFRIRRAAATAQARFGGRYEVRFKIEPMKTVSVVDDEGNERVVQRPVLDDAQFLIKFSDAARLSAGQFKVPFSGQSVVSDRAVVFPERSMVVDGLKAGDIDVKGFGFSRDIGVMLSGRPIDALQYDIGVFGGEGTNVWPALDIGYLYTARASFEPMGKLDLEEADFDRGAPLLGLAVQAGINHHPLFDDAGESDGSELDQRFGAEARFKARGFTLVGEGYFARATEPDVDADTGYGFHATTTYYAAAAHLLPAARFSMMQRSADDETVWTAEASAAWLLPNLKTPEKDDLGHKGKIILAYVLGATASDGPLVQQVVLEANLTP